MFLFFIGESVLESFWTKGLFTNGIMIYSRQYSFTTIPSVGELAKRNQSWLMQPMTFKEFNKNEIGFRESMLIKSFLVYTPIMRGIILINYNDHIFQVKGFINYRSMVFILLSLLVSMLFLFHGSIISIIIPPLVFLVMGILYIIQLNRFDNIGFFISQFR
jgi:hypothetical protein